MLLIKLFEAAAALSLLASIVLALAGVLSQGPRRRDNFDRASLGLKAAGAVFMGSGVVDHANLMLILFGCALLVGGGVIGRAARSLAT